MHPALKNFHPVIAAWFDRKFAAPTPPQILGWPSIASGRDTLIAAPTGSGKTLAAFLACLNRLIVQSLEGELKDETSVIYVSPLKALSNDIQKNLEEPLNELAAAAAKEGWVLPKIRTALRTGDTTQGDRAAILKNPPHILITTPESLYLMLTAEKSRKIFSKTSSPTVIVDEIHAIVKDKRGSHLALSLERLDRLVGRRVTRVGLSATQKPIEEIARFLVGTAKVDSAGVPDCTIVNAGHRRDLDLAIEIPDEEFSAVASKELWEDVYDRVAELVREHRSTLVFVNTRRLVERATHALSQRLGEESVAAHHGSLSKEIRLDTETRLKSGATKAVVATASLELGIDVGAIDLVCHLGSPRSLAVGLQRIGRAGHAPSRANADDETAPLILPKGRIFPVTRDELIECAAFVRGVRRGNLEHTYVRPYPLDILAQQIVASVACEEFSEDELFDMVRGAWPYAKLPRKEFDQVVTMLSEGIATGRGSRGAWLHRDGVAHTLKPRRGARLVAITSGGAIPDNFNYAVVKEPEGIVIGSLEEDFAVESLAGDVFLLGNSSWKIQRVETGRVRVVDAHGQPPTIPFWLGEAPGRSAELSWEVSDLRKTLEPMLETPERAIRWLQEECGVPDAGAGQIVHYLSQAKAALGALPTQEILIAERFFDEGGGMQLVLHAPFGGRMNRAFGLALRKKFCAGFNFELQAAATDDGILLSLGPQHSFPLETVFNFLSSHTVETTLEQAVLDAPVFGVRWRWDATRALALLRQSGGKRLPPIIQRMRSDDLLAATFPDQAACQENVERPIKIPDHPLVTETMRDCLYEAMDLEGIRDLLGRIERHEVRLIAKDTPTPSPLTHEILNSNPYTYLDDAPLEERRARAVSTRRILSEEDLRAFGGLDPAVIEEVEEEIRPDVRTVDELADLLRELVMIPKRGFLAEGITEWSSWMRDLVKAGRALEYETHFVSTEKKEIAEKVFADREDAVAEVLTSWLRIGGPATAAEWANRVGLPVAVTEVALLRIEAAGTVLRGNFKPQSGVEGEALTALPAEGATRAPMIEWVDRDVIARIHRRCLGHIRQAIEPATTAEFVRYLLEWQHVVPGSQLEGPYGLLEIIQQLQGLQIPAAAWEQEIFPARLADYQPSLLNELCLNGSVVWGRLSVNRAGKEEEGEEGESPVRRRALPHRNTTVSLMLREDLPWLLNLSRPPKNWTEELGDSAKALLDLLQKRGPMFFNELKEATGRLRTDLDQALWELVAAGAVTCDGFSGIRNLIDPDRRREKTRLLARYGHGPKPLFLGSGGRWSLIRPESLRNGLSEISDKGPLGERVEIENIAQQYLRRWGIVFRDLAVRDPLCPPWRVMLGVYRRLEARGEIRGGRFVAGFAGEQFALPVAVEALRAQKRKQEEETQRVQISAADPLNVTGLFTSSTRIPAKLSHQVTFVAGVPWEDSKKTDRRTALSAKRWNGN